MKVALKHTFDNAVQAYAEKFTSAEPPVLRRLRAEAYRTRQTPQQVAGPLQGRLLTLLARMIRAKRILEIGTFVGYSALCFAEGLPKSGRVVTLDNDPTLLPFTRKYFSQVPYGKKITVKIGQALEILPKLKGPFDLVYIDADKVNYARYYDTAFPKVSPGGLIVADNLFWSGAVLDEEKIDPDTQALRAFARKIQQDKRVEPILLTVRDGLMLIRKRSRTGA